MKNPMHPGEFISLLYMEPLELQSNELADRLGVSPSTLSRILNQKMDISYEMAIRLSAVLGRSPESWINLQAAYSLNKARSNVDMGSLKPFTHA
jgi:addiction module HigA family antidote